MTNRSTTGTAGKFTAVIAGLGLIGAAITGCTSVDTDTEGSTLEPELAHVFGMNDGSRL
ncbi:hypothetical protein [Rhodococcus pyridinivorans]|uniref:hypothetical protein n=1 Tax=Rhodococcus pyridinivorans TaxID=103816 RepID=UPI001E462877|nr:hypothetical protein [Rhodococcus pyridinivorans]MCD2119647.1 hypothetical protein [Rhodococcus pyridinivorans]MCZ4628523.1 hypothetical protein [Rhodococcus pyridinivorans]MCZ4649801.1 hypothetical protein [Rhodococcus pyridinivorans]MDJ0484696.1 hypothetical protein [Rhodococcus pyridinivorans]MDV7255833.1 hypothetical protein [Rhodococcus pyridinivorans]